MSDRTASDEVVFIVLDPLFGARLHDLPARNAVWAVLSPANEPVLRQIWAGDDSGERSGRATGMQLNPEMSNEDYLAAQLPMIALHHPFCVEIDVIGNVALSGLHQVLRALGFTKSVTTFSGFRATRSPD